MCAHISRFVEYPPEKVPTFPVVILEARKQKQTIALTLIKAKTLSQFRKKKARKNLALSDP